MKLHRTNTHRACCYLKYFRDIRKIRASDPIDRRSTVHQVISKSRAVTAEEPREREGKEDRWESPRALHIVLVNERIIIVGAPCSAEFHGEPWHDPLYNTRASRKLTWESPACELMRDYEFSWETTRRTERYVAELTFVTIITSADPARGASPSK